MSTLKINIVTTQDYYSQTLMNNMKWMYEIKIKILATIQKILTLVIIHRIATYEINKISLSCYDNKICIQNNGCDGLALGY